MTLSTLIKANKKHIIHAWRANALDVYPEDARRFFGGGRDRFGNPVGQTLAEEMSDILDAMTTTRNPESWASCLTRTLKIRAVQDMRPADALKFIFHIKTVLGGVLRDSLDNDAIQKSFADFDANVDAMALFAFEIYAKHREKVFEVRISDVKRQVSHLLKRSAFFTNDEEVTSEEESISIEPKPRRQ
jgi:hypothetical protein